MVITLWPYSYLADVIQLSCSVVSGMIHCAYLPIHNMMYVLIPMLRHSKCTTVSLVDMGALVQEGCHYSQELREGIMYMLYMLYALCV